MNQPLDGLTEALVKQFEFHHREYVECGSHSSMASMVHMTFEYSGIFLDALKIAYHHRQEMARMLAEREES